METGLMGALGFLQAVLADCGASTIAAIAAQEDVPLSTAQRWAAMFERNGLLVQGGRGRRIAGLGLHLHGARLSRDHIIAEAARPLLRRYCRKHGQSWHLGVWDGEMVRYLIKASTDPAMFTREGMRLEGYCSAIGKVLLADLPEDMREAYLEDGPFIPLTANTMVDPDTLRRALAEVQATGIAADDQEVAEGLFCRAVPIRDRQGRVQAAVSVSQMTGASSAGDFIGPLRALAAEVEARLFPAGHGPALHEPEPHSP